MDFDEFEGSQGIWSEHLPEFTPADFGEDHWEYNDAGWSPDPGWEADWGHIPYEASQYGEDEPPDPDCELVGVDFQSVDAKDSLSEKGEAQISTTPQEEPSSSSGLVGANWNSVFVESLSKSYTPAQHLCLPWETGVMKEIFSCEASPLRTVAPPPSSSEMETRVNVEKDMVEQTASIQDKLGAHYVTAVRNLADAEYFEIKQASLDLASSKWCALLQHCSMASEVGQQLVQSLQKDPTGQDAEAVMKAVFGVKSPTTLLKRAGALKRYFDWVKKNVGEQMYALPFHEEHVWEYFLHNDQLCKARERGYTVNSEFLETVRFCKFMFGMKSGDGILSSRRLVGKAAITRSWKGPLRQAPPLSIEQMTRLHDVMDGKSGEELIDRLAAGCFLIALYARARWSDLRFINHVEFDVAAKDALMTIYTREHKTAGVGLRREQFLPLIVPRHGVVHGDWLADFRSTYTAAGLSLEKVPLGPLLQAPKASGGWCMRPLTTTEAGAWLRNMLRGTMGFEHIKTHSLKATWCCLAAQAGLSKEVRAVLSHHSTALHGSDVIYSRDLQVQPLRKLQMLIKKVRIGLAGDIVPDFLDPEVDFLIKESEPKSKDVQGEEVLEKSSRGKKLSEEVKDEPSFSDAFPSSVIVVLSDEEDIVPTEKACEGLVPFAESSGSSSDSDSSSVDSSSESEIAPKLGAPFVERVPEGVSFFKHTKSQILHRAKDGAAVMSCGASISKKFVKTKNCIYFKYPHCLKCFPKDKDRIRTIDQAVQKLDDSRRKRLRAQDK